MINFRPKSFFVVLTLLTLILPIVSMAKTIDDQTHEPPASDTSQSDLSLSEILNLNAALLTHKELSLQDTPGIASIITREQILSSGARDLQEALLLYIPNFNFATDVEGEVGLHMRGFWAQEGKVLLLLDGLEMNDRVFGNAAFGNHLNLDNVDHIEVVRGPGSAQFGGYAEVATINVITLDPKENHAYVHLTNSQMSQSYSNRGLSVGFGKEFGDLAASLNGTFMAGNRSQIPYNDGYSN